MKKESFSQGVFIMAGALFLSKFLGFLYVLPFVRWVGSEGYILYEYAYKPYAIMIMVATMGIPGAVSKFVSKYKQLGDDDKVGGVFNVGLLLTIIFAVISFLILFLSAEYLAEVLIKDGTGGNTIEDVALAIKIISFSLIIVPPTAFLRGYVQGQKIMFPSSLSQLLEQLTRVTIIIISTYIIVVHLNKKVNMAINASIIGTVFSSIIALLVMVIYMKRNKLRVKVKSKAKRDNKKILRELSIYMIPFIFVGSSITIFQTVDTFMINATLMLKGFTLPEAEAVNASISLILKLVFLPVTLATALSASLVPYVTADYEAGDTKSIRKNITRSLFVNFYFVLPASVLFTILSRPIYTTAFGMENSFAAGDILSWYGFMPVVLSLYTLTSSILQGMNKIKWIIISLLIGLTAKLIINKPLLLMYDGIGTAYSNYIGFGIMIAIQGYIITKEAKYNWLDGIESYMKIIVPSIILILFTSPIGMISITTENYWKQIVICLGSLLVSGVIYLILTRENGGLNILLKGTRIRFLKLLQKK